LFKDAAGSFAVEQRFPAITAEGDEVKLPGMLVSVRLLGIAVEVYSGPPFAKSAKDGAPSFP
jgi:hypothetical protein